MSGRLSKNTAYVLCNRYISLTDFNGQLISLILDNVDHYIYMIKVGDLWFEFEDVKITKIECNNFCNSVNVYMLF